MNEGWLVIDDVPNEMNTIKKFWEDVYGCAVAISELEYVETEPISDSRPYSQAGLCAKESLDNAIDNIKSI